MRVTLVIPLHQVSEFAYVWITIQLMHAFLYPAKILMARQLNALKATSFGVVRTIARTIRLPVPEMSEGGKANAP